MPKVAFIKQEALEKAREIKVKADEEFAIEKVRSTLREPTIVRLDPRSAHPQAKLVKQEQHAIDAQYEKKFEGVETAQKMSVRDAQP